MFVTHFLGRCVCILFVRPRVGLNYPKSSGWSTTSNGCTSNFLFMAGWDADFKPSLTPPLYCRAYLRGADIADQSRVYRCNRTAPTLLNDVQRVATRSKIRWQRTLDLITWCPAPCWRPQGGADWTPACCRRKVLIHLRAGAVV